MHDNINEKISQFIDDELDANEAIVLLQEIQFNPESQNTLYRYEAMHYALKSETVLVSPKRDFLAGIHQAIEQDPVYLLPQQRKVAKFKVQHKVLALVASAAIVAVILPKSMTTSPTQHVSASTAGVVLAQQIPKRSLHNTNKQIMAEQLPLNAQINDYLQQHNKEIYAHDDIRYSPFARITAYDQK